MLVGGWEGRCKAKINILEIYYITDCLNMTLGPLSGKAQKIHLTISSNRFKIILILGAEKGQFSCTFATKEKC